MALGPAQIAAALHAERGAFKAFLAARVGGEAEAEDLLQQSLLKAVQRAGDLRDDTRLSAWFYQLLRHALIDHYRAQDARRRRHDALGELTAALGEDRVEPPPGWTPALCACLAGVIGTLPSTQAELLRRVELGDEAVQDVARSLGLKPNHASVTLHRARLELRRRLEKLCGECTANACLDCDCADSP